MAAAAAQLGDSTGGLNSTRQRQSLSQMLASAALPTWRQRFDRSEDLTSSYVSAGRTDVTSSARSSGSSGGPALTLDQILTPAKTLPDGRAASQEARRIVAGAMERGAAAADVGGRGPYQYDYYPSADGRPASPPHRQSPFAATRELNDSNFYPTDVSTTLIDSRANAASLLRPSPSSSPLAPASAGRFSTRLDGQSRAAIPTGYTTSAADTQKRIHALMRDQRPPSSFVAMPTAVPTDPSPPPRSFPRTAAATAAKGARSLAQMKMDVALRMHDRSHPSHAANLPTRADSAGIFHLSHHSAHVVAQPNVTAAQPALAHPLQPDGQSADRRARTIVGTAHTSTVPLTQAYLAANAVPIPRGLQPVESVPSSAPPLSFFPSDAQLPRADGNAASTQAKLPQSAYLATMHAGAVRVEHLLAQPRMQQLLDVITPAVPTREHILAQKDSPPRTQSNVDRFIYDTIKGQSQLDRSSMQRSSATMEMESRRAHSPPRDAAHTSTPAHAHAMASDDSSSTTHFSRASLLHREARLDAMLALSASPLDSVTRLTYDPAEVAAARRQQEESPHTFFDAHTVLEEGENTRYDVPRLPVRHEARDRPSHSNMSELDAVVAELLGSSASMPSATHATTNNLDQGDYIASPSPSGSFGSFDAAHSSPPSATATTASATSGEAAGGFSITQREFDYLTAATSISPVFHRAALHDAYAAALDAKADSFRFIATRHLLQDAFDSWRGRFDGERERARVLQTKRHEGQHGYDAWCAQQSSPIDAIRRERAAKEAADVNASGVVHQPPAATSALLSDLPVRPACVSLAAIQRKTFVSESSIGSQNDLLARVHAKAIAQRRTFLAWRRWTRTERIGARLAAKVRSAQVSGWFRNWRDLMRIVRGEFHMWMHSKQTDAIAAAEMSAQEAKERDDQEAERHQRAVIGNQIPGAGISMRDVPAGQSLYARSSSHIMGAVPVSHSRIASPVSSRPSRDSSFTSSPNSASTGGGGVAPLASLLSSAFTQDQFWSHQEAIWRSRRAEEEAREQFAQLKLRVQGRSEEATGSSTTTSQPRTSGPLLFQVGNSLHKPVFGVATQLPPVAHSQAGGSNYLPNDSNVSVELRPYMLTSPVRTQEGVLHQSTGQPVMDRMRIDRSPTTASQDAQLRTPLRTSPSPHKVASPRTSPLRPPSFLYPSRGVSSSPTSTPLDLSSPVRRHVVPEGGNFGPASPARDSSITTHGYLPSSLAPGSHPDYFRSSHWQPPSAATATDEELLENIRISREMARTTEQLRSQNQFAQWNRIEVEKQLYRQKVQEQHAHRSDRQ